METLEGNQIHVIKPVLPKLNKLFEYAVSEENGCWLFHPSWHLCIYKRVFESGNKILTKEGITHFLELCETRVLPFSPEFSEFIVGPLMDTLSESSLYSCFLLKFIQRTTNRHWCAVPILLLFKALANVPRCKTLCIEGLLALRDALQGTSVTRQILLRGAAQCCLLQTAVGLVDVERVSLLDVSTFLMSVRQEDPLGRWTSLWTEDQHRINPKRNTARHMVIKLTKINDKEKILKSAVEKRQKTYKGTPIRLSADFSAETPQARRESHDIFKVMKGGNLQSRILFPSKTSQINKS